LLASIPTTSLVRIVDEHLIEADAKIMAGIAAQMLVGKKEQLLAVLERPLDNAASIAARANGPSIPAAKGLQRRRGVNVRDRHPRLALCAAKDIPSLFHLVDVRHVGHRAPSPKIGQENRHIAGRYHVRGLRHEMHTGKNHELHVFQGGSMQGEIETVATTVGKGDDIVALVVMSEDDKT
jgi:hypothetical protein